MRLANIATVLVHGRNELHLKFNNDADLRAAYTEITERMEKGLPPWDERRQPVALSTLTLEDERLVRSLGDVAELLFHLKQPAWQKVVEHAVKRLRALAVSAPALQDQTFDQWMAQWPKHSERDWIKMRAAWNASKAAQPVAISMLTDEQIIKAANIGAVYTERAGRVERRPEEYRQEMQRSFLRGARWALAASEQSDQSAPEPEPWGDAAGPSSWAAFPSSSARAGIAPGNSEDEL